MQKALAAVKPDKLVQPHLTDLRQEQITVIGFGKAAAQMALGVERALGSAAKGLVITPYGYETPCKWIKVRSGSHPIPDKNSISATKELIETINNSTGLLLALMSGGGSSVLCLPASFVTLQEKQNIITKLLQKGTCIAKVNKVRGALSCVKNGGLARIVGKRAVRALTLSDVAGDNIDLVASGPFSTTKTDKVSAINILDAANIEIPDKLRADLEQSSDKDLIQTNIESRIIGCSDTALQAAASWARSKNIKTRIISDSLEGDACEIAKYHLQEVYLAKQDGVQLLLSGGEVNVEVTGKGVGGSNRHFLLTLALELQGVGSFSALAIDTDGRDGSDGEAGAWVSSATMKTAKANGINPVQYLMDGNSGGFFKKIGTSIYTGPTGTNVNDFRVILI
jgi:hydroxypyruvate reductase